MSDYKVYPNSIPILFEVETEQLYSENIPVLLPGLLYISCHETELCVLQLVYFESNVVTITKMYAFCCEKMTLISFKKLAKDHPQKMSVEDVRETE